MTNRAQNMNHIRKLNKGFFIIQAEFGDILEA